MRLRLVFGAGVAGLVVWGNSAAAQPVPFGGGQPLSPQPGARPVSRTPELPGGLQPVQPQYPQQPVVRATYSVPQQPVNDTPHPWAVKPENGAWMILVKGYVGPESRAMAEALCKDIREAHKVAAYLFERNGEERKREQQLQEAIRKKAEEDAQPFLRTMEQEKKRAEAQGMVFVPSAPRIKVPKPLHPVQEQWAVMIGGFPTADAARKALDQVRKLPPPKDTRLLEQAFIAPPAEKGAPAPQAQTAFLNPYASAMVLPNPTNKAAAEDRSKLDPFMVELNKDVPNGLLSARKPWTLIVKSFSTPTRLVGKEGGNGNIFDRATGALAKKHNYLDLTAAQATQLCETLRHRDMKPAPLESFVLHHRTGSIVTVGQFDAADDPELLKLQTTLRGMTFQVMDEKTRTTTTERMFDSVSPFPVPRH